MSDEEKANAKNEMVTAMLLLRAVLFAEQEADARVAAERAADFLIKITTED